MSAVGANGGNVALQYSRECIDVLIPVLQLTSMTLTSIRGG